MVPVVGPGDARPFPAAQGRMHSGCIGASSPHSHELAVEVTPRLGFSKNPRKRDAPFLLTLSWVYTSSPLPR